MEKLKHFFTTTESPRWHTYLVSLFTVIFTVVFTIVGNSWKSHTDIKIAEEKALTDSMIQFQVHASSFASSIMDNTSEVEKARSVLLENLNEQYARAKQTEGYGGANLDAWRAYEDAIVNLRDVIDKTGSVDSMGPFWTASSKLLVARNRLRERIRQSV